MKTTTKTATVQIKETATALQFILYAGCLLTLIAEFSAIRDLYLGISGETVTSVLANLFYLAIELTAALSFRTIAKNETPFLPSISRNIKIIGGLIMFAGAIPSWVGQVIYFVLNVNGDVGGTVIVFDNIVIMGIVVGLIFACFGAIFDYGCQLQKQDDELL